MPLLFWNHLMGTCQEALLGQGQDCVLFSLTHYPTCYRRGPWRLLVEVTPHQPWHHFWGCFDDADQPERHYHSEERARAEAEAIALVLARDRLKAGHCSPALRRQLDQALAGMGDAGHEDNSGKMS